VETATRVASKPQCNSKQRGIVSAQLLRTKKQIAATPSPRSVQGPCMVASQTRHTEWQQLKEVVITGSKAMHKPGVLQEALAFPTSILIQNYGGFTAWLLRFGKEDWGLWKALRRARDISAIGDYRIQACNEASFGKPSCLHHPAPAFRVSSFSPHLFPA